MKRVLRSRTIEITEPMLKSSTRPNKKARVSLFLSKAKVTATAAADERSRTRRGSLFKSVEKPATTATPLHALDAKPKYQEKKSDAKDFVNQEFVRHVLELGGKDHRIVLLDGPGMETSRALIKAGIAPEFITVAELDPVTHEMHQKARLGVQLVNMDIFAYLDQAKERFACTGGVNGSITMVNDHRATTFPTVVYADLMGSASFVDPVNLTTMYNWRMICGVLNKWTGREFMCVYTVSARGRVFSPFVGESKIRLGTMEERFDVLARYLKDFCGTRSPKVDFGLFWHHGYRRDARSSTMYQAWFKSNPEGEPLYTPKKLGRRGTDEDGQEIVEVYYYGFRKPSLEPLDGEAAQLLLAREEQ